MSLRRPVWLLAFLFVLAASLATAAADVGSGFSSSGWQARFSSRVESLRAALRIPGLSAAIVRDGELVWAQGCGYSDVENQIQATAQTPYEIASLTKPFAAFLVMRLVENGMLDLDTPITQFGIDLGDARITVRHLLSHTSEGVPGSHYHYNGSRYASLTSIIEQLYEQSFRSALRDEILAPLGMNRSALNCGGCGAAYFLSSLAPQDPERAFEFLCYEMATPYLYDSNYGVYPTADPSYANAGAGLISTVVDLARFAVAIEDDQLVEPSTQQQMFTPTMLNSGASGPYGLGWFVETVQGTQLIWHYGYGADSSLLLMIPSEKLALVVLANSQNLSRPFLLGAEGVSVLASPFALEFVKQFVLEPRVGDSLPEVGWTASTDSIVAQLTTITAPELRRLYEDELWTYRKLYAGVGRFDIASRLLRAHSLAYPDSIPSETDLYQVEVPARRATAVVASLSPDEVARWVGRYVVAPGAPSELPAVIEIHGLDDGTLGGVAGRECTRFVPRSATRLEFPITPGLFLVAVTTEVHITTAAVEFGGRIVATYERQDRDP